MCIWVYCIVGGLCCVCVYVYMAGGVWRPWECPIFAFCSCNIMSKDNLGRKGYIWLSQSQSITKGSQGRNSRWEPGGGHWSRDHGRMLFIVLLSSCWLWLLSYTTQDHRPGTAQPTVGWALLHLLAIKMISYRCAVPPRRWIWWANSSAEALSLSP